MGRLATDIGGTFTDLVYFDEQSGALSVAKSLSTPDDLTRGVLDTVDQAKLDADAVDYFVHGGTTVINAITERTGARTALVTTEGFRDVLEIARGNRPDLYNLRYRKEVPFVPRRLRFEVRERVDARGRVRVPLHLEDLDRAIEVCRAQGVEAIAIQFLHSYAAPAHEVETAAYLRERLNGVAITASHEITREWREYERANTAVLNAYVQPIVQRYFDTLEAGIDKLGLDCPMMAMQSNGGTASFGWAREHPITLLESGPAAGVNGAALIGRLCDEPDVIYLDIGGTTAKCSTIEDSEPKVTTDYRLEATRIRYGYPVRVPVIDIVEIGAGGGSIAWFDEGDTLCVGPRSAGADPGPACYGRGGTEPTVTDAKLITGVLNPANFAGGQFSLDVGLARTAMGKVAEGLGCSVDEAAVAVIRLVDANMINALKLVSIQRGHDPNDFALMVGGGGGAMHGASLGRELGVKEIVVPRYPGLFSAWGMLATAPRRDFLRTALQRADTMEIADLRALFAELQAEAGSYFASEGGSGTLTTACHIDMRYGGQEHAVTIPIDFDRASRESILDAFHAAHERAYTFRLADTPVELVTFRLTATADVARPELQPWTAEGRSPEAAARGARTVDFGEDGVHDTAVYDRDLLPPGFAADGPLIVEEPSSTTLVCPGQRVRVDDLGFLRITEA